MEIQVWSDIVCPWCYLGKRRLEVALEQVPFGNELEVVYRSFQLDPSAPAGETVDTSSLLATKYGMNPEQVTTMQHQMEERAAADGLEYHLAGQRSGNTGDAHRTLQLARHRGRQVELLERLFRAYFTEQASVFDTASLQALTAEVGLDADEVAEVLASRRYADEVAADIEQARRYGITGVPFYVLDGRLGVSGAQSPEVLRQAIEEAHASAA